MDVENELSDQARELLVSVQVKLESTAVFARINRALQTRPELRSKQDLQVLAKHLEDVAKFQQFDESELYDLCRVMRLITLKEDEYLNQDSVYFSGFHSVVQGSVELQEAIPYSVKPSTYSTRASRSSDVGAEGVGPAAVCSTSQAGSPPSQAPAHELLREESEPEAAVRSQFPEIGWWFEELVEEGRARGVKLPGRGGPGRLIAALATEGLARLLPKLKDHEITDIFIRASLAGQDFLTQEEFSKLLLEGCPGGFHTWGDKLLRLRALKEVFNYIDGDGSGAIDAEEMHSTLVKAGAEVPYDTVAKMVNAVDSDGSGEIDFDEFLSIMQTCVTSVPEYSFKMGKLVQTLGMGCHFGECTLDLGDRQPPVATVKALQKSQLLVLDRRQYQMILQHGFEGMVEENSKWLMASSLFAALLPRELAGLAAIAQRVQGAQGTQLAQEGSVATAAYIVVDGQVEVLKQPEKEKEEVILTNMPKPSFESVVRDTENKLRTPSFSRSTGMAHLVRRASMRMAPQLPQKVAMIGAGSFCGEEALLEELPLYSYSLKVKSFKAEMLAVTKACVSRVVANRNTKESVAKLLNAGGGALGQSIRERENGRKERIATTILSTSAAMSSLAETKHHDTARDASEPKETQDFSKRVEEKIISFLQRSKNRSHKRHSVDMTEVMDRVAQEVSAARSDPEDSTKRLSLKHVASALVDGMQSASQPKEPSSRVQSGRSSVPHGGEASPAGQSSPQASPGRSGPGSARKRNVHCPVSLRRPGGSFGAGIISREDSARTGRSLAPLQNPPKTGARGMQRMEMTRSQTESVRLSVGPTSYAHQALTGGPHNHSSSNEWHSTATGSFGRRDNQTNLPSTSPIGSPTPPRGFVLGFNPRGMRRRPSPVASPVHVIPVSGGFVNRHVQPKSPARYPYALPGVSGATNLMSMNTAHELRDLFPKLLDRTDS